MATKVVEEYRTRILAPDDTGAKGPRPHISHTQVSMVEECSLKWWLRYVCKIRKPQTVQMMTGDLVHQFLARNFNQKWVTGVDLDYEELEDEFRTEFDNKAASGRVWIAPNKQFSDYCAGGLACLKAYLKDQAYPLVPKMVKPDGMNEYFPAVEVRAKRRIPGTDTDFLGVIDLWTETDKMVDYKVGRKWGKSDMSKLDQSHAYGFLVDDTVPFEFHVMERDTGRIQVLSSDVARFHIEAYGLRVANTIEMMEGLRDGSVAPRVSSKFCNEHMCLYCNDECRAWKMGMFDPDDYRDDGEEEAGELVDEEDL